MAALRHRGLDTTARRRVAAAAAIAAALLGAAGVGVASASAKPSYNCTLGERASLGFHVVDDMHRRCNNLSRPPMTAHTGHERASS